MKKNLILMSALFAGSMFMNNGFGSNNILSFNRIILTDNEQKDEDFNPREEDTNNDDNCYNPSKEEFFNDIDDLYYDNIEIPIMCTDTELHTAQNDLKKSIESEYAKLPLIKRMNKKTKKIYLHTKGIIKSQIINPNFKLIKRTATTYVGTVLSVHIVKHLVLSL